MIHLEYAQSSVLYMACLIHFSWTPICSTEKMFSNMNLSIYNNVGSPHLSAPVHLEEESLGVCLSSLPSKQKRGCLMIWHQGCFPGNNVPGLMCHFTAEAKGVNTEQ